MLIGLPGVDGVTDMWQRLARESRPIVVYGMGNGADKLFSRFSEYGITVSDVFASDGFVRGHSYRGFRVKSYSEISDAYSDFVIVVSFASRLPEVIDYIKGLSEKHDLYIPDMPVDGDEYFDSAFYKAHFSELSEAEKLFYDEDSKKLFEEIVRYKLSGDIRYLESTVTADEMYALMSKNDVRVAIDAGAYNGDTAREMKRYFNNLKKIYAIEPDKRNFKKLLKYSEAEAEIEVMPINAAVADFDGVTAFSGSGNRNSSISSTPSFEHSAGEVRAVVLDTLTDEKIDYIKYDVEGMEYAALTGSFELIKRDRPMLLVSLYHKSSDLYKLPLLLAKELAGYRFYLRRLSCIPAWELNLILIPDGTYETATSLSQRSVLTSGHGSILTATEL